MKRFVKNLINVKFQDKVYNLKVFKHDRDIVGNNY